jgi:hypothetical protein
MLQSLLLAMQAAGMVTDYLGAKSQQQFAEMGYQLQQAGIESNIQQTRLEAEDQSLMAMKELRKNLGTQIAAFAARGTRTGAGSALSFMNESLSNFKSDERLRRMNLMGKETSLRGGAAISRLQHMSETSKLWQGFAQRTLTRLPSPSSFGGNSEGFGLTSIGS